jgi:hypothetical protein
VISTSLDSAVNEGILAIPVLPIRGPLADHVLSIGGAGRLNRSPVFERHRGRRPARVTSSLRNQK